MMAAVQRDTLQIRTADNVGIGYDTAGLASRFCAFVLDSLLQGAILLGAYFLLIGVASSTQLGDSLVVILAVILPLLVTAGYFTILEATSSGRTPGKRALGLRVIRTDGSAPGLNEALVRNIVRLIEVPTGIVALAMFFNRQSRRLGDLAAGTLVVRERPVAVAAPVMPPPLILRTPDAGPAIDGVDRLGGVEYSAIRAFLSRYGLTPEQRQRLAGDIAGRLFERMALPPEAPERQWPPELFLERLYLQLAGRLEGTT
jgi:uncharacterized RDD family membrane protein YckC